MYRTPLSGGYTTIEQNGIAKSYGDDLFPNYIRLFHCGIVSVRLNQCVSQNTLGQNKLPV